MLVNRVTGYTQQALQTSHRLSHQIDHHCSHDATEHRQTTLHDLMDMHDAMSDFKKTDGCFGALTFDEQEKFEEVRKHVWLAITYLQKIGGSDFFSKWHA